MITEIEAEKKKSQKTILEIMMLREKIPESSYLIKKKNINNHNNA